MNVTSVEPVAKGILGFVEKYPHLGIFASFSGLGAALLAAVKVLSIIFGFAGAIFGAVAGYYTMRVWHKKWQREKAKKDHPDA